VAQLTYTQLVAKVLVNLRENADATLATAYGQLVAEFINQAKQKVEDAFHWKTLTTNLTFTTVQSQTIYPLVAGASPTVTASAGPAGITYTGNLIGNLPSDERSTILRDEEGNWQVFDVTTAASGGLIRLLRQSREREQALNIYLANQAPVQPNGFSYSVENGTPFFALIGAPIGGRSMLLRMKIPQPELVNATDTCLVPWRPIVSFATFLAMEERGDELAEKSALYLDRHNAELQRAIENDESGEEGYSQLKNLEGGGVGTLTAGFYGPV
jgi:hypothetical protein